MVVARAVVMVANLMALVADISLAVNTVAALAVGLVADRAVNNIKEAITVVLVGSVDIMGDMVVDTKVLDRIMEVLKHSVMEVVVVVVIPDMTLAVMMQAVTAAKLILVNLKMLVTVAMDNKKVAATEDSKITATNKRSSNMEEEEKVVMLAMEVVAQTKVAMRAVNNKLESMEAIPESI